MVRSESVSPRRVLIFDAQPVIRWGLKHFLMSQNGIQVVGEAGTFAEAMEAATASRPDVIIMDLCMPERDGLAAAREFSRVSGACILAFSTSDCWDLVDRFMRAGGAGFVPKRCDPEQLVAAIRVVANGQHYISPSLREGAGSSSPAQSKTGLSARQRDVAVLVARGLTTRQIADQLCLSPKTVETHRYRIFKALGIESRAQLVDYVIEHGLIGHSSGLDRIPA